jgi:predicted aspartyl protease
MRYPASPGLLLAAVLLSPIVETAPPAALPFDLTPLGAIIVPATVNGSAPMAFLLDTGSNGSVISDQLANALGLRAVARTTMVSASGRKEVVVARIGHLTLGTVGASDVLATIAPAADLIVPDAAALHLTLQGVVGQDVLGCLRYTIDYAARQIVWHESSADLPSGGSRFELERQDDRFLVRLPQDDRELRLVPDTGTEVLVLFQQAESIAHRVRPNAAVGLTGLAGTHATKPAVVRELRVGDRILTDVPAVVAHREAGSAPVDGLLPLHLFARVTFDGPERQLFIEAR